MQFFAVLLSTISLAIFSIATPLHVGERSELIVAAPPVIEPQAGDIWVIGTDQDVCWDTSKLPPGTQNYRASIYLSRPTNTSQNIDLKDPLATDVLLSQGCTSVVVPDVDDGNNYAIIFLGDSGDASGLFTITSSP